MIGSEKHTALGFALLTMLSLGAMACGGESGGNGGSEANAPAETSAPAATNAAATPQTAETRKPLAVLETTATRIEVFEDQPGIFTVAEEGPVGTAPLLGGMSKQFTLMQMYETVAPKLIKPLGADELKTLTDGDLRADSTRKLRAAAPASEENSLAETPTVEQTGASGPNFFDYNSDDSWFHENFCNPGQYCPTWVYWAHSGRHSNIAHWQCSVFNQSDSGTATLTLWQLVCSGFFCTTNWAITHTDSVAARSVRYYYSTSGNAEGVNCLGDGVNGTIVGVGLKYDAPTPPVPPKPAPSCGAYIYRAQTTGCTNGTDGSGNSQKWCANGCGATAQQAQDNATANLAQQTPLNNGWGSCSYVVDQNFNYCGY